MRKSILVLLAASVSASAFARSTIIPPSLRNAANSFTCVAEDGRDLEVNYTTSSWTGGPTFNVVEDGESKVVGRNNQVNIEKDSTPYGELVTASVTRRQIADAPTLLYSILVPFVSSQALEHTNNHVEFKSVLLTGSQGGFLPPWALRQHVHGGTNLVCFAQKVAF